MSLDTAHEQSQDDDFYADHSPPMSLGHGQSPPTQWKSLSKKIRDRTKKLPASTVFGTAAGHGSVYRWGVAVASGGQVGPLWNALSGLATDQNSAKKEIATVDFAAGCRSFTELIQGGLMCPLDVASASLWAAAMPGLIDHLPQQQWWELLSALQQYRDSVLQRFSPDSLSCLMIGGELGLTLSWRLTDLPSCSRLQKSSLECLSQWCEREEESISTAIRGGVNARLALAALIRSKKIVQKTTRRKFKQRHAHAAAGLASWVVAMTTHTGGAVGSDANRSEVADDLRADGLLPEAVGCDPETLQPALDGVLGKPQRSGRLAWEICLPESFQHSADAKIALLMPQWDVRRGRTYVDYGDREMSIELFGGKSVVLQGACQTSIEVDNETQQPIDDWVATCEYTDDDVHYFEIEQPWSGGIVLQRQIMVIRDDRCVLLADSVLPSEVVRQPNPDCIIHYRNRLPLAKSMQLDFAPDTREAFFSDGRRRGLVIPLSTCEWRMGKSDADLITTDDQYLLHSTSGRGRLFAPLWFDFQRSRFKRNRTWRQLTVAHDLRIVPREEAVAYRIQIGVEQWMLYRSLANQVTRSVLGKHLVADFFAARFDLSDGSFEELVTVDTSESDE